MSAMQAARGLVQASHLSETSGFGLRRPAAYAAESHCSTRVSNWASSRCFSCGKPVGRILGFGSSSTSSFPGMAPVGRKRGAEIVCMARERRVKMVSQQVKREISELLLYDKVLQAVVLPETALGADMYLTAVATISDVEMSKDLSVAKVYISIYGDERGQAKALEGLKKKSGYVRKRLAQSMNLKNTPEVRFIKDEALERGSRVISILDKLKKERELKGGTGAKAGEEEEDGIDQEFETEDMADPAGKDEPSFTRSDDDEEEDDDDEGDESDWEDDENITFIK